MSNHLKSLFQACRNPSAHLPILTITGVALAISCILASNIWAAFRKPVTAYQPKELADGILRSTASAATEKLHAQVILLRPNGFEPAEITRRKGQFLLVVLNRSGVREANYLLSRESGNKLREAKV